MSEEDYEAYGNFHYGMKMRDVKLGMVLKCVLKGRPELVVVVTEVLASGFKYVTYTPENDFHSCLKPDGIWGGYSGWSCFEKANYK